jgi:hypothetical protein
MTEQYQNPGVSEDADDTEGHTRRAAAEDPARDDAMADDTEGHSRYRGDTDDDPDEDDTEGHLRKSR